MQNSFIQSKVAELPIRFIDDVIFNRMKVDEVHKK